MVIFHLTSSELHTKPNSIAAHFSSYFPLSLHRSKCKIATSWCGNAWLRLLHTISNTFNFFAGKAPLTQCVFVCQQQNMPIAQSSMNVWSVVMATNLFSLPTFQLLGDETNVEKHWTDDVEHTVVIHKINFCLSLYGFSASCKCKLLLFDTKCIHTHRTQFIEYFMRAHFQRNSNRKQRLMPDPSIHSAIYLYLNVVVGGREGSNGDEWWLYYVEIAQTATLAGKTFVSKTLIVWNDRVSIASNTNGHSFYCLVRFSNYIQRTHIYFTRSHIQIRTSSQFHTIYKHMYHTHTHPLARAHTHKRTVAMAETKECRQAEYSMCTELCSQP